MYQNLLLETRDQVAFLTINRPATLNALDRKTLSELGEAFESISCDDTVRSIVVTGAGDKAFVAGADIRELAGLSAAEGQAYARAGQEVVDSIENLGKPVIAAVNGYALGGGCELAMACSFRIASDTAQFGQPEVLLGLIPGFGGSQRLPPDRRQGSRTSDVADRDVDQCERSAPNGARERGRGARRTHAVGRNHCQNDRGERNRRGRPGSGCGQSRIEDDGGRGPADRGEIVRRVLRHRRHEDPHPRVSGQDKEVA